jgi:hypothetical protein
LLSVDRDIKTTTLLGEALCLFDALLTRPRETLVAEADDVNGKLVSIRVELFRKVTR